MEHRPIDWRKYMLAFMITAIIFITAVYTNNYFNDKRIGEMRAIQDSISTNISSSEIEVALLSDVACEEAGTSMLSNELGPLAERIAYSEENIGTNNADVIALKKAYSLLELKDYLLMKSIASRCSKKIGFALYFYGDKQSCPDCEKASYVLTYLKNKYPELRVYSFDYNLDLSAVQTLITMLKIKGDLPAIVIDREVVSGFQDKEKLEKTLLSHYPKLLAATTTATSTKK
jgi:hypothetical protein